VWHEFCDWYLETIKPTLYGKNGEQRRGATLSVLWSVLKDALVLLHPFIPFITEEIWDKLPGTGGSIMTSVFPSDNLDVSPASPDAETEPKMELIIGIISAIRNVRGEMNISPSLTLDARVHPEDAAAMKTIQRHQDIIINLARLKSFSIERSGKRPKASATAIINGATIFIPLAGIVDFAKESKRLEKKIGKLTHELNKISKKLSNDNFLNKAPAQVVEGVKEKYRIRSETQQKLQSTLERIKGLEAN